MYIVYAIKSLNHKYIYVGLTSDLTARLLRHNSGYEKTTKPYLPFELIYSEVVDTREQAREREKFLKSTTGKRFLYKLINNEQKNSTSKSI